jgi:hypothetical protein
VSGLVADLASDSAEVGLSFGVFAFAFSLGEVLGSFAL